METKKTELKTIRKLIGLFIVLLVLSGLTAFPTVSELHVLLCAGNIIPETIYNWLVKVSASLDEVDQTKSYLLYGYDWLAFAHLVIALFFIGAWKDPVANVWVIRTGMVACGGVLLLAFICGPIRGIPIMWTFVDCSFGIFGFALLFFIHNKIRKLITQ
ncbi:MAG: hypothetical protein HY064_06230 [Bacteroidetes bacterium]|nr:hypothetical protein [Bacteroidota bacterium]